MKSDDVLMGWANFIITTLGDVGYSRTTALGRLIDGDFSADTPFSSGRYPTGVNIPGFSSFEFVEGILRNLKPRYRKAITVEYLVPKNITGPKTADRAKYLGLRLDTYRAHLLKVRKIIDQGWN